MPKKHSVGRELLATLISIVILILQLILAGERAQESQRSKDQNSSSHPKMTTAASIT
jgi:hypothetical protein